MRPECPDCMVYRSFPDHKGDCGEHCLLELDWDEVGRESAAYDERMKQKMIADGTWVPEMDK